MTDQNINSFPSDGSIFSCIAYSGGHLLTKGCAHGLHDNISCTRLRNYTIAYINMAATMKFGAKK